MDSTGCNTNGHVTMAMAQSQVAPLSMACSCCLRTADERPGDDVRVWVRRALLHGRAVAGPARCAAVVQAVVALQEHVATTCAPPGTITCGSLHQHMWPNSKVWLLRCSGGSERGHSCNVCVIANAFAWQHRCRLRT